MRTLVRKRKISHDVITIADDNDVIELPCQKRPVIGICERLANKSATEFSAENIKDVDSILRDPDPCADNPQGRSEVPELTQVFCVEDIKQEQGTLQQEDEDPLKIDESPDPLAGEPCDERVAGHSRKQTLKPVQRRDPSSSSSAAAVKQSLGDCIDRLVSKPLSSHLDARFFLLPEQRKRFQNKIFHFHKNTLSESKVDKISRYVSILEKSVFTDLKTAEMKQVEQDAELSGTVAECRNCGKCFATVRAYAQHLYAHTFIIDPKPEDYFLCNVCGSEIISSEEGSQHRQRTDCFGQLRVVSPCLICGMYLSGKRMLRLHLLEHTKDSSVIEK